MPVPSELEPLLQRPEFWARFFWDESGPELQIPGGCARTFQGDSAQRRGRRRSGRLLGDNGAMRTPPSRLMTLSLLVACARPAGPPAATLPGAAPFDSALLARLARAWAQRGSRY